MQLDGYYINLSSSRDRFKCMEAQLSALGYQDCITRFPAIDGVTQGPFDNAGTNGVWACRRSHEEAIFQSPPLSATLILEDDVEISRQFPTVFNESLIGAFVNGNPDADVLFFDCCPFNHQAPFLLSLAEQQMRGRCAPEGEEADRHRISGVNLLDAKGIYAYCAASYLVTPKGKQTLRALFPDDRSEISVDVLYREWIASGKLQAMITVPFLATPKFRNESTIAYAELEALNLVEREGLLSNGIRRLLFAGDADLSEQDILQLAIDPLTEPSPEYRLGMRFYEACRRLLAERQ
jgi:hypothetical protein